MRSFLLISIFVSSLFSQTVNIEVKGMHCPLCTTAVKKAVKKLDGIQKVKVRLNTKKVSVDYDENKTSIQNILKAIKTTTYTGVVIK